jgi:hypothetical protein
MFVITESETTSTPALLSDSVSNQGNIIDVLNLEFFISISRGNPKNLSVQPENVCG